ncbi:Phosphatidylinositol 5-phosphate 4-kinase type-2 alpha [Liparis tanakae]|uniref:Phosphatidylinositol 5-phosphate 4-kinase type-2 alpha n=1 Tax=Liparis tanakae TaxID=230148 RepID=A0A4Z2H218_9TELE|nr:Phosphatidylinositol 5-phosphate 4-kinase type-2 alpha [Liparis tanakae]
MASASSIAAAIASKTKTKKKHFVAQKVKLFRASDPLLSVLMWGVNHSVSQMRRSLRMIHTYGSRDL